MFFSRGSSSLQFGGGMCGITCDLQATTSADDYLNRTSAAGTVSVTVREADRAGLTVTVPYALPCQRTLLTASGARSGVTVHFAVSGAQGSFCPSLLGGACMDLDQPLVLGAATANARGEAWLLVDVPTSAGVGDTFYLQAAVPDGTAAVISGIRPVTVQAP